ncbi:unnamed protein product, partial [Prorocentrum cordatum]
PFWLAWVHQRRPGPQSAMGRAGHRRWWLAALALLSRCFPGRTLLSAPDPRPCAPGARPRRAGPRRRRSATRGNREGLRRGGRAGVRGRLAEHAALPGGFFRRLHQGDGLGSSRAEGREGGTGQSFGGHHWRRTLAFFLYGGFYQGCAQYFIFNVCYPVWFGEGQDLLTISEKVLFDQFVLTPFLCLPIAYLIKALTLNADLPAGMRRYVEDAGNDLLVKYWLLWGPVQCVTFGVVPAHWRVPFMAGGRTCTPWSIHFGRLFPLGPQGAGAGGEALCAEVRRRCPCASLASCRSRWCPSSG